jgi:hypothetical protein
VFGAVITLNPATNSTGTDTDAKTDARRNFFIQCSWEIKKIATNASIRKGIVAENGHAGPDGWIPGNRYPDPVFHAVMWGL